MARFYVELELQPGFEYDLPDEVVRHLNVVRLKVGQQLILFNGDGCDYSAQLLGLAKRNARIVILATTLVTNEAQLDITLGISVLASDKFDLVIHKAVELGVSRIMPVYSQNTQRFNAAKLETRLEHWRKIILSASEQCGRAKLARVDAPVDFAQALDSSAAELKLILSPHHSSALKSTPPINSCAILIGPEGGFTQTEIVAATAAGFQSLLLGPRILRAETAAFAALSYVHSLFGDFISNLS